MTAGYAPPADARPAASLLLLRDGEPGLEVLMLRRAERDGDLRSGAVVFPGGVLDARDRQAHGCCVGWTDAAACGRLGLAAAALDYAVAALRETFEEVGLLLAGPPPALASALASPDALHAWRQRLQTGSHGIGELCDALGLHLALDGLEYWSHWLTPPGLPKRFDTRFFAARAPAGQQALADGGEALELMWLTPAAALDPQRGLKLLPVTRRTLQELQAHGTAAQALAAARARREVPLVMPRVGTSTKGPRILLPDELPYAEVARLDPHGRHDAFCDLLPGRAVQLSPHIWRVTAPNPGVMTGPGTNSYLVGAGAQWTLIDPGPDDAAHRQALLAAAERAGGAITRILVTHTHADHSPGAAALARATGAPVWGRLAEHPQGQDAGFEPQHQPQHGERFEAAPGVVLRVLHTPGHASNHLCWLLESEKTLFTGDHVMQGSTVVINPPDGDMAAYLRSLQAVAAEDLEWLAPGHGFLVAQPQVVLQGLIAHRLRREARVLAALPPATGDGWPLDRLLPVVYADTPVALHPVARRSLLAHLLKLAGEGRAQRLDGECWRGA